MTSQFSFNMLLTATGLALGGLAPRESHAQSFTLPEDRDRSTTFAAAPNRVAHPVRKIPRAAKVIPTDFSKFLPDESESIPQKPGLIVILNGGRDQRDGETREQTTAFIKAHDAMIDNVRKTFSKMDVVVIGESDTGFADLATVTKQTEKAVAGRGDLDNALVITMANRAYGAASANDGGLLQINDHTDVPAGKLYRAVAEGMKNSSVKQVNTITFASQGGLDKDAAVKNFAGGLFFSYVDADHANFLQRFPLPDNADRVTSANTATYALVMAANRDGFTTGVLATKSGDGPPKSYNAVQAIQRIGSQTASLEENFSPFVLQTKDFMPPEDAVRIASSINRLLLRKIDDPNDFKAEVNGLAPDERYGAVIMAHIIDQNDPTIDLAQRFGVNAGSVVAPPAKKPAPAHAAPALRSGP